jgi:hypothetical protein
MAMINKRKITNENYNKRDVETRLGNIEDEIRQLLSLMPTIYQADQLHKILTKILNMKFNLPEGGKQDHE